MGFSPPVFNLPMAFWEPGHLPGLFPPDLLFNGQVYMWSREWVTFFADATAQLQFTVGVRSDLVSASAMGLPRVGGFFRYLDDGGHSWYLLIESWYEMHRGFPNEYIQFCTRQCSPLGATPDPGR